MSVVYIKCDFLECPICFLPYTDPTTFPCGHSCCLEEAKKFKNCPICDCKLPSADKMTVNYVLRNIVLNFRNTTGSIPVELENLSVDSRLFSNCTSDLCLNHSSHPKSVPLVADNIGCIGSDFLECPICFLPYKDPTTFPCGHSCCLEEAKQFKNCPTCCHLLSAPEEMTVNYVLRNIVLNFKSSEVSEVVEGSKPEDVMAIPLKSYTLNDTIAAIYFDILMHDDQKNFHKLLILSDAGNQLATCFNYVIHCDTDSPFYNAGKAKQLVQSVKLWLKDKSNRNLTDKYYLFVAGMYCHYNFYPSSCKQHLMDSAKLGFVVAQLWLRRTATDLKESFYWTKTIADQGFSKYQCLTADYYSKGVGVDVDKDKAFQYYCMAADQEHSGAHVNVGNCYYTGNGVGIDMSEAFKHYLKAAELDDPTGQLSVGRCYLNGWGVSIDKVKAFEYSMLAANQNCANAVCDVGIFYYQGIGVAKDTYKAIVCFEKASVLGSTEVNYWFGTMCPEFQSEERFRLFKLAADGGCAESQYIVGTLYEKGKGVKINTKKALNYFNLAADQGHTVAQVRAGLLYMPIDAAMAFYRYKAAADLDDINGQYCVAQSYLQGLGVVEDKAEGYRWMKLAAAKRHPHALYILGLSYSVGDDFAVDKKKAFIYFKLAADLGNLVAQYEVSRCYSFGDGVAVNQEESQKYLQLASSQCFVSPIHV